MAAKSHEVLLWMCALSFDSRSRSFSLLWLMQLGAILVLLAQYEGTWPERALIINRDSALSIHDSPTPISSFARLLMQWCWALKQVVMPCGLDFSETLLFVNGRITWSLVILTGIGSISRKGNGTLFGKFGSTLFKWSLYKSGPPVPMSVDLYMLAAIEKYFRILRRLNMVNFNEWMHLEITLP